MNLPRYAVAGGISLLIHGTILFVAQEPKAFAMPAGQTSTAVSINFKAMTVPPKQEAVTEDLPVKQSLAEKQRVQPEKVEPIQEIAPEPQPSKSITKAKSSVKKPVEKKPKKVEAIAEKKPAPKKPVSPQKNTPDIPKKKAQKSETKVSEVKPEPTTPKDMQPETKPPIVENKPDPKVEPEKHTEVAESAQPANSGASSQPILVTKPTFVTRPTAPKYPRLAKRRGIQGVATYEVWLDEDGNQVKQALVSSSGALMLDEAALKAIKQWEFSPHIVNGRAMAHRVKIPVRFKLDR